MLLASNTILNREEDNKNACCNKTDDENDFFYDLTPQNEKKKANATWLYQLSSSTMPEKEELRRGWSIFDNVITNNQPEGR